MKEMGLVKFLQVVGSKSMEVLLERRCALQKLISLHSQKTFGLQSEVQFIEKANQELVDQAAAGYYSITL